MGILTNFFKKKDRTESRPAPKPHVDAPKSKGGSLLLCIGLLIGAAGGMAAGSYMPELGRGLLQLEPLIPESNMHDLQQKVAKLTKEKAALEKKVVATDQKPEDKKSSRREKKREFIDEIGTQGGGQDIARTDDLPVRSAIPQGVDTDTVALDFSKINLDQAAIDRLMHFQDNGAHFFLAFSGDFCKEGYALASILHDRYPDMPVGISFYVDKNEHVLLYAAWLAIRLINEEEGWNFLNYAFNNGNFPNSDLVLQDYENFNPKFSRRDLINFWSNHKNELHAFLDAPYTLRTKQGFASYKLPFVTVHGKIQESRMEIDNIRNAFKGKLQLEGRPTIRP